MAINEAGRLTWLDGLRAVAILLVIARHVFDRPFALLYDRVIVSDGLTTALVLAIGSVGWAGVGIFFVISGYLVAGGAVLAAHDRRFFVWEFLAKRVVRVFVPAAAFLILWSLVAPGPPDDSLFGTAANFLFFANYTDNNWLAQYWSLDVEAHFYLVVALLVPLAARFVDTRRLGWGLAAAAALFALIKLAVATSGVMPGQDFYAYSHWQIDFFAAGAALRLILDGRDTPRGLSLYGAPVALVAFVAAAIVLVDASESAGMFVLCMTLVLIAAVALCFGASGAASRFFGAAPLRAIGAISFSVYIVHLPLIEAVQPWLVEAASLAGNDPLLTYLTMLVLATALSLAAGAMFYVAIERPAYRWHQRIRLRPRLAPPLLKAAESR
ncbi:MAG TPA: acyltransferase [Stellaceae bacterium]|nr:acyltransferase [Stellaceae bacterium]